MSIEGLIGTFSIGHDLPGAPTVRAPKGVDSRSSVASCDRIAREGQAMKHDKGVPHTIFRTFSLAVLLLSSIQCEAAPAPPIVPPSTEILPSDRRIEWRPGITGGIPLYPVAVNVKSAPYNAKGDGIADDTAAIKQAIASCPSGRAVYIPAGTYRLTSTLRIQAKGIVLRGDGPGLTRLISEATSGAVIGLLGSSTQTQASVSSKYAKDSTTIIVSNASSFRSGDYILISQENDPSVCEEMRSYAVRAIAQIVKISGISGNTISINRPLYYSYNAAFSPQIQKLAMIVNAGVEDLYVEKRNNGTSDPSIYLDAAANCWIKNVEGFNATGSHVELQLGYANEIRGCYFHHGHSYTSGRGYGVFFLNRCTDNLVEDNIFYYLRHAVTLEWGGCGNVIGYNYAARLFDDNYPNTDYLTESIHTHGGHPYMNLFEGNVCSHIVFDNALGSSRHNTAFRNHVERYSQGEAAEVTYNLNAVEIQRNNLYENVIGNVLCRPGDTGIMETTGNGPGVWKFGCDQSLCDNPDTRPKATVLRHGNFDFISGTTSWDPNIDDHNLPPSLYLSSKPAFFGDLPWPIIGPDISPVVSDIPAKKRFHL